MLTKLYDIEENEAETLIEQDEPESNTAEPIATNEGTNQEIERENEEGEDGPNNN